MNLLPAARGAIDPGPKVRGLIALVLRVGLGMSFLNGGLRSYALAHGGFGGFPRGITSPFGPLFEIQPFLEVAIGLALIVGFFTTLAAVAAGVVILFSSTLQTLIVMGSGPNSAIAGSLGLVGYLQGGLPAGVVLTAAVLWFSTVENNPWSLDRLIFPQGRAEAADSWESETSDPDPDEAETTPARAPDVKAPPPGARVAKFIAGREE